ICVAVDWLECEHLSSLWPCAKARTSTRPPRMADCNALEFSQQKQMDRSRRRISQGLLTLLCGVANGAGCRIPYTRLALLTIGPARQALCSVAFPAIA